jgi:hypothetical protein
MQLRGAPVSAVKISVWPGKFTPDSRNASLWIGAVTAAAILPASAARIASSI